MSLSSDEIRRRSIQLLVDISTSATEEEALFRVAIGLLLRQVRYDKYISMDIVSQIWGNNLWSCLESGILTLEEIEKRKDLIEGSYGIDLEEVYVQARQFDHDAYWKKQVEEANKIQKKFTT